MTKRFGYGFERLQRQGFAMDIVGYTRYFDVRAGTSITSGCTGFIAKKAYTSGANGRAGT